MLFGGHGFGERMNLDDPCNAFLQCESSLSPASSAAESVDFVRNSPSVAECAYAAHPESPQHIPGDHSYSLTFLNADPQSSHEVEAAVSNILDQNAHTVNHCSEVLPINFNNHSSNHSSDHNLALPVISIKRDPASVATSVCSVASGQHSSLRPPPPPPPLVRMPHSVGRSFLTQPMELKKMPPGGISLLLPSRLQASDTLQLQSRRVPRSGRPC
jgi:hypothetical protein